ncbi:MAG TPA: hypothetical protein PKC43_06190 [Phycisphaerales bacterium]|nr:hypothetical protein [Phycisphaerales bacterium]HMP37021.1 hypothetical protein [Phycisphaerales bacterium]
MHIDIDGLRRALARLGPDITLERAGCGAVWVRPARGLKIFLGGSTWTSGSLAIDASCADLRGKVLALRIARLLAQGWQSILVAIGGSTVVFAGGRMIGRVPEAPDAHA